MAHGEIVSIPLVGTWSLRPVFVTDSDFEGLLKLPKHRHSYGFPCEMCEEGAEPPGQQSEVRQDTVGISGDTTWAQPR